MTRLLSYHLSLFFIVTSFAQYNPELSKSLCQIAVASYCQPSKIANWTCAPCKNSSLQIQKISLLINSTHDTLGFISISKKLDSLTIVFRGTLPWLVKNLISDMTTFSVPYPLCEFKCKVHEGFYHAYLDIHDKLIQKVRSYTNMYSFSKIIVIGHSLGAAIATHAVSHLIVSGYKISLFQTFGSPRIGNSQFVDWFQNIYPYDLKPRVTHGRDPMPHVPPKEYNFKHIQTEIFYESNFKKGYKVCNDDKQEDKTCSDKYIVDLDVLDHTSYYDMDFIGIILACQ